MTFEIVEWRLGGGVIGLSPLPHTDADAATLTTWRPDVVLSLTSDAEIADASAESVLCAGPWLWLQHVIEDFGVPDEGFAARWTELSETLLRDLSQGARVLVHCRGGCGRSGMVVLALMVAQGAEAGDALKTLRDRRPCAVETDAQMVWATKGRVQKA